MEQADSKYAVSESDEKKSGVHEKTPYGEADQSREISEVRRKTNFQLRTQIHDPVLSELLKYGIRDIVLLVDELKKLDPSFQITAEENIGDPIAKGHNVPMWIKEYILNAVLDEKNYAYPPSLGLIEARQFIAKQSRETSPASQLTPDRVVFFNGLGHAIGAALYDCLGNGSYGICPSPGYPSHNSTNDFKAGKKVPEYRLAPENDWMPDFNDLEKKIKENPHIAFITIVNPNNPTGAVYTEEILEKFVEISEKYGLFLISDEIYCNLTYENNHIPLHTIVQDRVPLITMRGMSKDIPAPGLRCGWIEIYNPDLDESFSAYTESLKQSLRIQVGATTMPQAVMPKIYGDDRYPPYLKEMNSNHKKASDDICSMLNEIRGIICVSAKGSFYLMPMFEKGVLKPGQKLEIHNPSIREYIEKEVNNTNFPPDKRFCYYLLAARGIITVPASDFGMPSKDGNFGFRVTTLEKDPEKRKTTYTRINEAVKEYLASAN